MRPHRRTWRENKWRKARRGLGGPVVAAAEDNKILAIETYRPRVIYIYNIDTKKWRKYEIPRHRCAPNSRARAAYVAFGNAVYMFGGIKHPSDMATNAMWKLSINGNGVLWWRQIMHKEQCQSPAPRYYPSMWEYGGKLWSFGGSDHERDGYLNRYGDTYHTPLGLFQNQLMCFNPESERWTDMRCTGDVPRPWNKAGTARINGTLWLYSKVQGEYDHALYQLDLASLRWTRVSTSQPSPALYNFSFTAVDDNRIMLHGGYVNVQTYDPCADIWVLDVNSLTWTTTAGDKARYYHSAVRDPNSSTVFMLGGYDEFDDNIEDDSANSRFTKPHRKFSQINLEPKKPVPSLQSQALQCIAKHRKQLPLTWLPNRLQQQILLPGEWNNEMKNNHSRKRLLHYK